MKRYVRKPQALFVHVFSHFWNELLQPHLINSLVVVDISPVRTSPSIMNLSEMLNAMVSIKLESKISLSKARNMVDLQLMETIPVRKHMLTFEPPCLTHPHPTKLLHIPYILIASFLRQDPYVRQFLLTNLVEVEGGYFKWRVNIPSLIDNFSSVVNFKPPNGKFKGPTLFIGGGKSSYLQ